MKRTRHTLTLAKDTKIVLQIRGDDGRMPIVPTYVMDVDFDAMDGQGHVSLTQDRKQAKRFDTPIEAFEYWKTQSKVRPVRPDGRPNRPLTSYTVHLLRENLDPL